MSATFDALDDTSFVEALQRCDPKMRGLAWRLIRSENETDDVLQDAYFKAHRKRASFSGDEDAFVAWLYRITYNACLDFLRSRSRRQRAHQEASAVPRETIAIADTIVSRAAVRYGLGQLKPEWAAAVVLIDLEEMTYAEAADALGLKVGTVSTNVNRGRSRLRQLLNLEGTL